MLEESSAQWREILGEAIQANANQPTIGTHFRESVSSAATKRGLQFPPPEEPHLRFIQLLQRYPEVVAILRRPSQDFLVVPAGRSDLLTKGVQGRRYGIRHDLFEAFTTVSENRPYYDRTSDGVIWHKPQDGQVVPELCIPIEATTEAAEAQLRRDLLGTLDDQPSVRSRLQDALAKPQPLAAFGRAVRDLGLQREWHAFRTERVLERIQRWARDNQLEWKDAWLTEGPSYEAWRDRAPQPTESSSRAEVAALQVLFSGLDAADIQRISIPLDLVLKAIASSKKS